MLYSSQQLFLLEQLYQFTLENFDASKYFDDRGLVYEFMLSNETVVLVIDDNGVANISFSDLRKQVING